MRTRLGCSCCCYCCFHQLRPATGGRATHWTLKLSWIRPSPDVVEVSVCRHCKISSSSSVVSIWTRSAATRRTRRDADLGDEAHGPDVLGHA